MNVIVYFSHSTYIRKGVLKVLFEKRLQSIKRTPHIIRDILLAQDFKWLLQQAEKLPAVVESRNNLRFLAEEQTKEIKRLRAQLGMNDD